MVSTVVITGIDNFKIYKEKNEVSFWMKVKNLPEMVVAVAKNIDIIMESLIKIIILRRKMGYLCIILIMKVKSITLNMKYLII